MFKDYRFRHSGGFTVLPVRVHQTSGLGLVRGAHSLDLVSGRAAFTAVCGLAGGICRVFTLRGFCGTGVEVVIGVTTGCGAAVDCLV